MEKSEGLPSDGVWGYPPQGNALMKKRGLGESPSQGNALKKGIIWKKQGRPLLLLV